MLQDGMVLMQGSTANMEGSAVKGLAIEAGSTFPTAPTDGQKFRLTSATADYEAGEYNWSVADAEWTNIFVQLAKNPNFNASGKKGSVVQIDQGNSVPYDIGMQILSKPDANAVVGRFISVRPFSIPDNFAGSIAKAKIAPVAAMVFKVLKNDVQIGTVTFAAGSINGVFSNAVDMDFVAGDTFTLVAPASQDTAFTEAQITFVGTL